MALGDSLGDKSLDNVTAITLSMQDLNAAMKSANKVLEMLLKMLIVL